jgi:glycyl-tRNA synthetase beta chain
LRRQALGISHILLEGRVALSLERLVETAYRGYEGKVRLKLGLEEVKEDVAEFFKQRLKGIFGEYGFSYDVVDAVLACDYDNFSDVLLRARALADFRREPAFGNLLTAFVRANNLAKNAATQEVDPARLEDASEKEFYSRLCGVREKAGSYLERQDYRSLLAAISTLQEPVDKFFNSVMVMVEDEKVRENRLALLANLASLVKQVADLSKVVVEAK